jgi:DNA-binding CsgD family transcriptional regulator
MAGELADSIVAQSCEALSRAELADGALAVLARALHLEFAACYEETPGGLSGASPDHLPAILGDYVPYVATDPLHALKQRGLPPIAVMTRLVDRDVLRRSAVYNEFYTPMRLIHHAILRLDRKGATVSGIVLCRGERRGDFDSAEVRLLGRLLPPLSAAARRFLRFETTVSRVSLLERLLDGADPAPRFVVDADGAVVWRSPPMQAAFSSVLDTLTRDHPVIRAAMALCRGATADVAHEVACADRLFKAELTLVRTGPELPLVEARLRDDPAHRFGRWCAEHGLTPGEVAVLRQLARGANNQGIARALFISANTVRTHLNRIFKKLGTTSRLETVVAARAAGL